MFPAASSSAFYWLSTVINYHSSIYLIWSPIWFRRISVPLSYISPHPTTISVFEESGHMAASASASHPKFEPAKSTCDAFKNGMTRNAWMIHAPQSLGEGLFSSELKLETSCKAHHVADPEHGGTDIAFSCLLFWFPCCHCTTIVQMWSCLTHTSQMSRNTLFVYLFL